MKYQICLILLKRLYDNRSIGNMTTSSSKIKSVKIKKDKPKESFEDDNYVKKKSNVKTSKKNKSDVKTSSKKKARKVNKHDDSIVYFKTKHTPAFKQAIERISSYVSECKITFKKPDDNTDDDDYYEELDPSDKNKNSSKVKNEQNIQNTGGLTLATITQDQSVYIKLRMYANNFDKFKCQKSEYSIGVDMQVFQTLLKMIADDSEIEIYMKENNPSVMFIQSTTHGQSRNDQHKTYLNQNMNLLEIKDDTKNPKRVEFQNMISIETGKFNSICKKLNTAANKVSICCTGGMVTFTAKSESGKAEFIYSDTSYKGKCDDMKMIQGSYDIKNLLGFSKCNKLCEIVQMYFLHEFPLVLVINVTGLGKLYIFVSPLVQD